MTRAPAIPHSSFAALALLAAVTAGCADPKAASDDNFRKALQPVVADAFCTFNNVPRLEVEGTDARAAYPIQLSPTPPMIGAGPHRSLVGFLDDAAKRGLLVRSEAEAPARGRSATEPYVWQRVISYAPTTQGEPYFRAVERRTGVGMLPFPAFCPARGEVVDVRRWTEPADLGGRRVTQVTYGYRGVDPASLVPASVHADLATPKEDTVTLVQTSEGWERAPR